MKDLNDYANCKINIQQWLEMMDELYHPNKKEDFESIIQRCKYLIIDSKQCIDIIEKLEPKKQKVKQ